MTSRLVARIVAAILAVLLLGGAGKSPCGYGDPPQPQCGPGIYEAPFPGK